MITLSGSCCITYLMPTIFFIFKLMFLMFNKDETSRLHEFNGIRKLFDNHRRFAAMQHLRLSERFNFFLNYYVFVFVNSLTIVLKVKILSNIMSNFISHNLTLQKLVKRQLFIDERIAISFNFMFTFLIFVLKVLNKACLFYSS